MAIFLIGLFLMCAGILAGVLSWILAHFVKKAPDGRINVRQGGFVVKPVFVLAIGGGLLLGFSLIAFVIAALWWLLAEIFRDMTPGGLALLSLGVGILDCFFLGFDLNNLVYAFFMSYWAVFLTGGLAVFGLIGSGIWAIF
jgi:hypothetical protein